MNAGRAGVPVAPMHPPSLSGVGGFGQEGSEVGAGGARGISAWLDSPPTVGRSFGALVSGGTLSVGCVGDVEMSGGACERGQVAGGGAAEWAMR